MSTDTYIDFHTARSWELWNQRDGGWEAWSRYIQDHREDYETSRIGYVHNFTMDCNIDDYYILTDLTGRVVDDELIVTLLQQYEVIFNRAKNPPQSSRRYNDNTFCRDDIATPEEIRRDLEMYRGRYIYFRVD